MRYKFLRKIFAERIVAGLIVLKHIFGLIIKMNIKYFENPEPLPVDRHFQQEANSK